MQLDHESDKMTGKSNLARITQAIRDSIIGLFNESDFDNDVGEVSFLGLYEHNVWLGLFPTDENGKCVSEYPAVTWMIEISRQGRL